MQASFVAAPISVMRQGQWQSRGFGFQSFITERPEPSTCSKVGLAHQQELQAVKDDVLAESAALQVPWQQLFLRYAVFYLCPPNSKPFQAPGRDRGASDSRIVPAKPAECLKALAKRKGRAPSRAIAESCGCQGPFCPQDAGPGQKYWNLGGNIQASVSRGSIPCRPGGPPGDDGRQAWAGEESRARARVRSHVPT